MTYGPKMFQIYTNFVALHDEWHYSDNRGSNEQDKHAGMSNDRELKTWRCNIKCSLSASWRHVEEQEV